MAQPRLTISHEDLQSPEVDERLKRQETVRAEAERDPSAFTPTDVPPPSTGSFFYNTAVYMAIFGLLGGILGWGFGEFLHFRPNARTEARDLLEGQRRINSARAGYQLSEAEAQAADVQLRRLGKHNPYFMLYNDATLSSEQRQQQLAVLDNQEGWTNFFANLLFYSVSGMTIAMCLGMADSVVCRNLSGAIVSGSTGAVTGLIGGIIVSLFVDRLHALLLGSIDTTPSMTRQMIARAVSWGLLGLFLMIGPGLLMRNARNLMVGMLGGLIGGIVGGLLFDPLAGFLDDEHVSRLVGIAAIGLVAGISTGLIESIAKVGWLKVTAGWIAGKQFVIYRNPTYIGSSLQCSIYLFNDAQVGRRHAAIYIVPNGFEIENLPLGGATIVNGKPITKQRLHKGDRIQVGQTRFLFEEKPPKSSKS